MSAHARALHPETSEVPEAPALPEGPAVSAARFPWRDGWPYTARAGDGNAWVTGRCWFFCRREDEPVLWVGSVRSPGGIGNVYACGLCVAELDRLVRIQVAERDLGQLAAR